MHKSLQALTLFQKIWNSHIVIQEPNSPAILYVDRHLVHEVTSPQAFTGLKARGLKVRRPDLTTATVDHGIPTRVHRQNGGKTDRLYYADELSRKQISQLETNCIENGISLYGLDSESQGIVHVIGPELGFTQPGMTIVCGDSHTSTHGAFGALSFGIGTSEVEHVLATQCLLQHEPKTLEIRIEGRLSPWVTAKDIILAIIAHIGVNGGTGHVIEYTGPAVQALDMEARMTVCNMSIEAGARAGMIAPDDTTIEYLAGRPFAPQGAEWEQAVRRWRSLPSDAGAQYDRSIALNAAEIEPMVTYGTNPGAAISVNGCIPNPDQLADANQRSTLEKALAYMDLKPGQPILGHSIDVVFIGSCTNGRLSDLRAAASLLKGQRVAPHTRVLVVPGSQQVKRQAEAEGLAEVFREAGAEWREPGCSMCIAMNGDQLQPGQYAVSTSNRNFEGRQGKGGRTFLASPLTAAASAIRGQIADPREL